MLMVQKSQGQSPGMLSKQKNPCKFYGIYISTTFPSTGFGFHAGFLVAKQKQRQDAALPFFGGALQRSSRKFMALR